MANSPTEYELVAQGQFFSQQGLLDKAIECFDRAIIENSNFAPAYYYRGMTHRNLGDLTQAINDYSTAIRVEPDYPVAFYARGVIYRYQGEFDKAIADYDHAITCLLYTSPSPRD